MSGPSFTLLECAAGYALFEVVGFEEIGSLLEGSRDTVTDLKRFGRAVKLKGFMPFESAQMALENANAISEHAMTEDLHDFLEMNLPKKSKSFTLGVIDPALATAISDGLGGVSCRSDDTVKEILRGCRMHLETFVKGLEGGASEKAQLGLGHSYSRSKVKFNPARSDNMIIQSIALLDQMDKDLNTFAMRIREWYSWHFPELRDIVKDNIMFARAAAYIQDKSNLCSTSGGENGDSDDKEDMLPGLIEIVGDEETAKAVQAAAKTSMGMDCSAVDMVNIVNFTQRMVKLAEFRKNLSQYLTDKMNVVAPNLSALIGDTVGARLISKAGSLTNLAKAPASTVQILGAEKALFRALKTKGNTPKYGLIYHSTFIGRADAKNKGRISRYLANKCSIATRIDSFSDEPSRLYGEKLREQVEERLNFYETGAAPRRNVDVMEEVAKQLKVRDDDDVEMADAGATPKSKKDKKKKSKKDKKRKASSDDDSEEKEPTPKKAKTETPKAEKDAKKDKKSEKKKKKSKS
ncbi:C/D box methylation guide ribonucleoprotein complex aNOP56 subunit [Nitzschia inconspicua]|uniref:Nucleolar protein 56 n=1 Tax=Nitzschia inconspicua TaxID=303405 RepID=A0A9K3M4Z5_9STRA|nr:C/D box methylation guide ribonucleoprotein complex aNOP56 subunit [Nitzschia inconspicua]